MKYNKYKIRKAYIFYKRCSNVFFLFFLQRKKYGVPFISYS